MTKKQQGYLGVTLQDLGVLDLEHLNLKNGVLIKKVYKNGPAHKAGLKSLDIVTYFDGHAVSSSNYSSDSLISWVCSKKPEDKVALRIVRYKEKDRVLIRMFEEIDVFHAHKKRAPSSKAKTFELEVTLGSRSILDCSICNNPGSSFLGQSIDTFFKKNISIEKLKCFQENDEETTPICDFCFHKLYKVNKEIHIEDVYRDGFCTFCGEKSKEWKRLVGDATDAICNKCVEEAYKKLQDLGVIEKPQPVIVPAPQLKPLPPEIIIKSIEKEEREECISKGRLQGVVGILIILMFLYFTSR